jgi:hypothetical protein
VVPRPYRCDVRRHRCLRAAATAALLCLAVAACGGVGSPTVPVGGGPPTVDVAVGAGSASLAAGETLRVDLGEANASIGDGWFLAEPPDPTVLTDRGSASDQDCDEPGCGGRLFWSFAAAAPGTTPVVFRYCYRSRPPSCEPEPSRGPTDPVTLTVTVR